MTSVAALTLTLLGGAPLVVTACTPPSPPVPSQAPTLRTAAPSVVVAVPVPTEAPAASAPPPTGPGTILCGETRCRAGAEICCLGKQPRCVPAPEVPAGDAHAQKYKEVEARQKACGTASFLTCDDAGDCGDGQTCCEETYYSDPSDIYQGTCRPLRAGRVSCAGAELCSADDPRCARKDNTCAGESRCAIPPERRRRPRCGKAPCSDGMTCVDKNGTPTCMEGILRTDMLSLNGVIECSRGRDCGEDESCYQNPQVPGRRCDFTIAGVDGLSERAYCTDAQDCVGYCRSDEQAVPSCHVRAKEHTGFCECLTGCTTDADCKELGCDRLGVLRTDLGRNAKAFCDQRNKACECR